MHPMKTRHLALLARLGPSAVLLWKRLARLVADSAEPVEIDLVDTLACVGLGTGLARNGVGARTVGRMIAFDLARRAGRDGAVLAVRTAVAPLTAIQADRLPAGARAVHDSYVSTRPARRVGLGKLHASPAAIAAIAAAGIDPAVLVARHGNGDWGDVPLEVALANNTAVTAGGTIASAYPIPTAGSVITVVTDTTQAATTTTVDVAGEHRSQAR